MAETEGDPAVDLPDNPRGLLWNIFHRYLVLFMHCVGMFAKENLSC